jgi:signal peptidase I
MKLIAATGLLGSISLVLARSRYLLVAIEGTSMAPTLRPGARVLARRVRRVPVRCGEVVVLRHPARAPGEAALVKRVAATAGCTVPPAVRRAHDWPDSMRVPRGSLIVVGDNPTESFDSRDFGFLDERDVIAIVSPSRLLGR